MSSDKLGPILGEGREAEIFPWGDGRVLRLLRPPATRVRVEREAAAMAAAQQAGVSVPTVHEIVVVDGRPGLVMDRVDGTDMLAGLARRPWRLGSVAHELARLQARLHDALAPPALDDLRPMLRERIQAAPHLSPRGRGQALDQLAGLPDGDRVCHGDFHPGNVIVAAQGPVVIDWANAARGDPTGDLARTILILRVSPLPPGMSPAQRAADRIGRSVFCRLWVRGYRRARPVDPDLLRRWLTVSAAARLSDQIDEEVASLLALLDAPPPGAG